MDWHSIGIGLTLDWHQIGMDWHWIGIGLTSDWHQIGIGWHLIGNRLCLIDIGLASD